MQIKSWQIVLIGNVPVLGFFLWPILKDIGYQSNIPLGGIASIVIFFYFLILLFPVLLLKSKNEEINKIGGFVSLLYGVLIGILFIMSLSIFAGNFDVSFKSFIVFGIIPFFSMLGFLIAGIYYFWKKV